MYNINIPDWGTSPQDKKCLSNIHIFPPYESKKPNPRNPRGGENREESLQRGTNARGPQHTIEYVLTGSEILIKGETAEVRCAQSVMHNVIRRIYCNKCNPRTLDPLDTNSPRIIQIITPFRSFPMKLPFELESQTCLSELNVFAARIAIWNNSEAIV